MNEFEREQFFCLNIYPHYSRGLSVAKSILSDHAHAEDAASVSLVKAWENLEQLKKPESACYWFEAITRNTAIDVYRRERRHLHLNCDVDINNNSSNTDSVFFYCFEKLEEERFCKLVHTLEPKYAKILILQYAHGLSNDDICRELSISESVRHMRAYKARKKLKELLKDA